MKKIFLSMVVPLVCMATLSAQISQKEADQIVIKYLGDKTTDITIYAKEDVQTGFEMITSTGESLELDYPTWVYFVSYAGETVGKYLIVKESSGNLLEINTKNDAGPDNLTEWKAVAFDIPFTEYFIHCYWRFPSPGELACWKNLNHDYNSPDFVWREGKLSVINSNEELEDYLICPKDYPVIDFSKHTLLLASGITTSDAEISDIVFLKNSANQYTLKATIREGDLCIIDYWCFAILTPKIEDEATVILDIKYTYGY
jgi:hypothetical protein